MGAHRRNAAHASCPQLVPLTGWKSQTCRGGKHPSRPGWLQTSLPGFAVQSTPGSALQPRDQRMMLSPPCQALGQGLCWTGRVPPLPPGARENRHTEQGGHTGCSAPLSGALPLGDSAHAAL